jgi:cell wall-associated NlpC family hydrolase
MTLPDSIGRWSRQDWEIFESGVRWAAEVRLDTLPAGRALALMGERFVGTPYRAGTLEGPGPEHVVVNLHELDCVTFVETVLALARFALRDGVPALQDTAAAQVRYESYLQAVRYRGATVQGYASRLHYFSDWLAENAAAGHLSIVTAAMGGTADPRPLTFMSSHASAYPALSDSATLASITATESRLNGGPSRYVLPKEMIAQVEAGIEDGDIIAAASTVAGLDVSHTGFAIWQDGALHLMHAPLTGQPVEISPLPLAQRISGIASQWGIMVARVLPAWLH